MILIFLERKKFNLTKQRYSLKFLARRMSQNQNSEILKESYHSKKRLNYFLHNDILNGFFIFFYLINLLPFLKILLSFIIYLGHINGITVLAEFEKSFRFFSSS